MSIDTYQLPKDPLSLARVLHLHAMRSETQLMIRRINWMLAWYYMNGYRRFDTYNPATGVLTPFYTDRDNKMEFQNHQLLFDINQLAGRFQSMDCMPVANAGNNSLSSIRNRAIGQIVADAIISEDQVEATKEAASYLFTCLGSVGLQCHLVDHPTIGLISDQEVIHPREVFPFPMQGQDHTKVRGIMRQQMIPLSYLKDLYGDKIARRLEDMEYYEASAGEIISDGALASGFSDTYGVHYFNGRGTKGDSNNTSRNTAIEMVRMRQLWLTGPRNTTARYVCASGDVIFQDEDLSAKEVYCPLAFSRFMNNGTFHGAGMFDLMFSQHRELEKLQKSLYANVTKTDRYGMLIIPASSMNQNVVLREVGEGLRAMFYEPDPIAEGFNPFPIQPVNSGDFPGKVAAAATESLRSLNPIQDIIQEKGRVDSASGLAFLEEQMNKAITTPSTGIGAMWGTAYKAVVQKAAENLALSKRALPVTHLTLDLAGAVIDPREGTVTFDKNPVPDVSRLTFKIKSATPKSPTARKQEAIQLWERGIEQDPMNFRMFCMKEGLDIALYMDDDAGAFEATVRMILMLYNDGETPGVITPSPTNTKPDLALRILAGFLTKPVMSMASIEVQDAFTTFRETLMQFAGISLPQAVPNPDDAAMLSGPPPEMLSGQPQSGGPQMALQ